MSSLWFRRLTAVSIALTSAATGLASSGASAAPLDVCTLSGQPYPEIVSVERTSPATVYPGRTIELEFEVAGTNGPYRVGATFAGPLGVDRQNLFVATGTTPRPGVPAVAIGTNEQSALPSTYPLYAVWVIDASGCQTTLINDAASEMSRYPRVSGAESHTFDFAALALQVVAPPSGMWSDFVAGAQTVSDIQSAVDYRGSDADTLRLYRAFMNRDPDVGGAVYWIDRTRNGSTADDLAWGFAQSQEFTNRYGTLSNQAFLTLLYDNMLGRAPDAAGLAYWVDQMNRGLTQHGAVRWIVANTEFINRYPFTERVPGNPGDHKECSDFRYRSQVEAWDAHFYPHYGNVAGLRDINHRAPCPSVTSVEPVVVGRPISGP